MRNYRKRNCARTCVCVCVYNVFLPSVRCRVFERRLDLFSNAVCGSLHSGRNRWPNRWSDRPSRSSYSVRGVNDDRDFTKSL